MLATLSRVQRSIRRKQIEGGAHIFVIGIMLILMVIVIFNWALEYKRIAVTKEMVDDAIVISLISSCVYNTEEYGRSGQAVIYRTVTPVKLAPKLMIPIPGRPPIPPYEPLDDPEIFSAGNDEYLNECYELFVRNLKYNLKLDSEMNAVISGIEGKVNIGNFSVYNVYREFDGDAETGFRIIRYTRMDNGEWDVYPYGINETVQVYSSFDDAYKDITETSVFASLTFDVRLNDYTWVMREKTENDMLSNVTYQRVVDIKIN